MNHGLKINGNILEITLPDNIHIDKVIVNRQIFSQRMQVCKSCKYHEKEGHEEPCVSCEVGNSNYVAYVEQEERTEERTETHACDLIDRQAAIEALDKRFDNVPMEQTAEILKLRKDLRELPSVQQERKTGRWVERNPQNSPDCRLIECSECGNAYIVGYDIDYDDWIDGRDFCMRCGADLRGGSNGKST